MCLVSHEELAKELISMSSLQMRESVNTDLLKTVSGNLEKERSEHEPFNHWIFDKVLDEKTVDSLLAIPFKAPTIFDHWGKRDAYNSSRIFFTPENCKANSTLKNIVNVFNNPDVISQLGNMVDVDLSKGKLRIEYTLDTGHFWLEPHCDIPEKLLTFLVYLSKDPDSHKWGTVLYNEDKHYVGQAPYKSNTGLMFCAGENTWHGFREQNIRGVRKNLIINYVTKDWRSKQELAPAS